MIDKVLQVPRGIEWVILAIVIVVLIFGAKKIPELARAIGRSAGEFKRGRVEAEQEARKPTEDAGETEREKVLKAARELGIETEGKSVEQLREEIKKTLS